MLTKKKAPGTYGMVTAAVAVVAVVMIYLSVPGGVLPF